MLDVATSQVAFGKISERMATGEPVEEEWTTAYEGKPDPEPMGVDGPGALFPFGGEVSGYKGFGLAVIAELLAATGSDSYVSGQSDAFWENEAVFILIDPLNFTSRGAIAERIDNLQEHISESESSPEMSVGSAAEGDELLLPGESEHRAIIEQRRNGVRIAEVDIRTLDTLAGNSGIDDRLDDS